MTMIDVEAMETIFSELAVCLQQTPEDVKRHMVDNAPIDYTDGVERAAALVAWLLLVRTHEYA
jgi:hypothetical protein